MNRALKKGWPRNTNSTAYRASCQGITDLRADDGSRSKRKSPRVSGLHSQRWEQGEKEERQRARGRRVECDGSIDPKAARGKAGKPRREEAGGGRERVGPKKTVSRECDRERELEEATKKRTRSESCRVSIC